MKIKAVTALLAASLLSLAAHGEPSHPAHGHGHGQAHGHAAMAEAGTGPHPVRGIFLGYAPDQGRVTIAHEAIPEVMMAMRMHLRLPEGEPAPTFAPGDKVAFQMFSRIEAGRVWYARELAPLDGDIELDLPPQLREAIGH